jgi:hypothetical protein
VGSNGAVVRTKVKKSGIAKLRVAPGVMEDLVRRGKNIQAEAQANAEAAGWDRLPYKGKQGMELDVQKGKGLKARGRVSVRTGTTQAVHAEAKDRALTRAFQAGKK